MTAPAAEKRVVRVVEIWDPTVNAWTTASSTSGGRTSKLERALAMAEARGDDDRLEDADAMLTQLAAATRAAMDRAAGRRAREEEEEEEAMPTVPYVHDRHCQEETDDDDDDDDERSTRRRGSRTTTNELALTFARTMSARGWIKERMAGHAADGGGGDEPRRSRANAESFYVAATSFAPTLPDAHHARAMTAIKRVGYAHPTVVESLTVASAWSPPSIAEAKGEWRRCWVCVHAHAAASLARVHLCVSRCLSGEFDAVATTLRGMGVTKRLSRAVFAAANSRDARLRRAAAAAAVDDERPPAGKRAKTSAALTDPAPYVVDGVLPDALLKRLRDDCFGPASKFWTDHRYHDPMTGYFSYHYPLPDDAAATARRGDGANDTAVVEDVIDVVRAALSGADADIAAKLATATSAEWWAHSRSPHEGHQLHFDADERALRRGDGAGEVSHPIVSAILFLESPADARVQGAGGGGGGTVVVDQRLGDGARADGGRAWVAEPTTNRVVAFDGSLLHGVLPSSEPAEDAASDPGHRRLTLMIGFWGPEMKPGDAAEDERQGPCVRPPWRAATAAGGESAERADGRSSRWWDAFKRAEGERGAWSDAAGGNARSWSRLPSVYPAWERVGAGGDDADAAAPPPPPPPGLRFFLQTDFDFENAYAPSRAADAKDDDDDDGTVS